MRRSAAKMWTHVTQRYLLSKARLKCNRPPSGNTLSREIMDGCLAVKTLIHNIFHFISFLLKFAKKK